MAPWDHPSVLILDNTSPRFKYSGTWNHVTSSFSRGDGNGRPYNSTLGFTDEEKATVQLEFEGKYIAFMGSLENDIEDQAPRYKCIVDGKTDVSPENYHKLGMAANEVLCESGDLSDGKHTAKLSIENITTTEYGLTFPLWFDYALYEPLQNAKLNGKRQRIYPTDSRIKLSPDGWTTLNDGKNGAQWPGYKEKKLKNPSVNLTFEGDTLFMYGVVPNISSRMNEVTYTLDGGPQQKFEIPAAASSINSVHNLLWFNFTDLQPTNHTLYVTDTWSDTDEVKTPLTLSFFDIRGTVAAPPNSTTSQNNSSYTSSSTSTSTSTPSSIPQSSEGNLSKKKSNVGVMVGATLGAMAGLAIIACAVIFFRAKRKGKAGEAIGLKQAGIFFKGGGKGGRYERVKESENQAW